MHQGYGALLRGLLWAVAVLVAGGCATPDMRPFAEQTARLRTAVSGEHQQIALRFVRVEQLFSEACARATGPQGSPFAKADCSQSPALKTSSASFAESERVVDRLLEKGVEYADSLAALAAAGETGGEAAQSLLGTVRQFGTLFGVSGTLVSDTVAGVLEKIAQAATRVQAQQSLADATAAAHDTVAAVADGIAAIQEANARTLDGLYGYETSVLLTLTGRQLVGLYRDMASRSEAVNERLRTDEALAARVRGCDPRLDALCAEMTQAWRSSEEIAKLLDRLKPEYTAYVASRDSAAHWRAERRANSANIRKAAQSWKAEHAKVAGALRRCGGTNVSECELNVAALRTAIDSVRELLPEGSK